MPGPKFTATKASVTLALELQRVTFRLQGGVFQIATEVQTGGAWRPLFDAERPLLLGFPFDLRLTRCEIDAKKRLVFNEGLLTVEAVTSAPLLRFTIRYPLPAPLPLGEALPSVALWRRDTPSAFTLDQGPDSIYGSAGIPYNFGFPAAYLWDEGSEAAIFFEMAPQTWLQPEGVVRFLDLRVQARREQGKVGLGLHIRKLMGRIVPAGEFVVSFALYQATRPGKPTGLEALATMVRAFAPLHPQTSEPPAFRWDALAKGTLSDLSTPQTMATLPAPWNDLPLTLVPSQEKMIVHPATPQPAGNTGEMPWDFSTVNNHLTPWLLLTRLHADTPKLAAGVLKYNALPRFYDPKAQLLRHGTQQPPHVGDKEMTWQNLFFHVETCRAAAATPAAQFNPAVLGRFLMGLQGWSELAQKCGYVFPQWFDPFTKTALIQNDVPVLGIVREPWQGGAYALMQLQGYRITGKTSYVAEAQRALETLFERLSFRVRNDIYDRAYSDPSAFPLTELFGNAHGALAAYQLYRQTRNPRHRRYADDFLHTLLRLTFWYEDEATPIGRELKSAGLFYPHGGAHVATPWETVEAHLAIAGVLREDPAHPLTKLLLRLSNLNRVNAFDFFPACWSRRVRAHDPRPRPAIEERFPIEPFYSLEGTGGHRGATAAYMASLSLWNHWLYDALAEADDPAVLALNLASFEGYEEALTGVERQILVYNPGPNRRVVSVRHKDLPEGKYLLEGREYSSEALLRGVNVMLRPEEHRRLTLRKQGFAKEKRRLGKQRDAQNALSVAYQQLQERAQNGSVSPEEVRAFQESLAACRAERSSESLRLVRSLLSG